MPVDLHSGIVDILVPTGDRQGALKFIKCIDDNAVFFDHCRYLDDTVFYGVGPRRFKVEP
jgi:hypothetical protein